MVMETKTSRLQVLLTAGVISLAALSAAGIATLTGLVPSTLGATPIAEPLFKATAPAPATAPASRQTRKKR
jgi:hypothetical protein